MPYGLLDQPLYTGGGTTTGIGSNTGYDIAIAGRRYQIDWSQQDAFYSSRNFHHETIPLVRTQSDASNQPSEASLNPEDNWRRGQDTWIGGAGQNFLDKSTSDASRFSTSLGIDGWTDGQFSLLPDVTNIWNVSGTTYLATAGSALYAMNGSVVKYTTDFSSWTTLTTGGTPVVTVLSAASDGDRVWFTSAVDTYYTTRAGGTYARWHAGAWPATLVGYAKGRLFTANGVHLYNNGAQGSAAPGSALFDHPNPDWVWTGITEGPNAIYFSGFSGDKSAIYRTAIQSDGTTLNPPVVAASLPDGEVCRAIQGYLGFMLLGTDKGVRFATADTNGDLTLGDLIPTGQCLCFEPQDRFVWFGWNNYDSNHTGLGRVDLRTFNGTAPAYATDLQAPVQGACDAVVTASSKRVFSIDGHGVYVENGNRVSTGYLKTGPFNYGLPDIKSAVNILVRNAPGKGTYQPQLDTDQQGNWFSMGGPVPGTTIGGIKASAGPTRAESFNVQFTLDRDAVDATAGPVITRWTLRVVPSGPSSKLIFVPLQLASKQTIGVSERVVRVEQERAFLEGLRASAEIVPYQEGSTSYSVIVSDFFWMPYERAPLNAQGSFDGTMFVTLKTVV